LLLPALLPRAGAGLIGFFSQAHQHRHDPVSFLLVLGLMKSPSVTNDWTEATAPPRAVEVGG